MATTGRRVERDGLFFIVMVDGLGHGPAAARCGPRSHAHSFAVISRSNRLRFSSRLTLPSAARGGRPWRSPGSTCLAALSDMPAWAISPASSSTRRPATPSTMVSHNGTVGYTIRKIQSYDYQWTEDSLLLMHSDGLATHWSLDRYAGPGAQASRI